MNQGKFNLSIVLACTFVAALITFRLASAQTTEPILRVEVGTHNAGIWGIAIDPSNRILVTGSEDKTVRVWDISGRGNSCASSARLWARGEEGQIFAVALSPDARTVACGGRTGSPLNKAMGACTSSTEPPAPSPVGLVDCPDTSSTLYTLPMAVFSRS